LGAYLEIDLEEAFWGERRNYLLPELNSVPLAGEQEQVKGT